MSEEGEGIARAFAVCLMRASEQDKEAGALNEQRSGFDDVFL